MKKTIGILSLLFSVFQAESQNLVPNGGFEDSVVCTTNPNTIHPALWFPPTQGSPDYYPQPNSAGCILGQTFWSGGEYQSPNGYQLPHSGRFYSGFYSSITGNIREYLEVKLSDSLIAGKKYSIEFYICLAEYYEYGYDGIGVSLSHDSIVNFNNDYPIPNLPFTAGNSSGNVITDTANWVAIRDTFIAIGGERYLMLGNIRSNAQTNYIDLLNPYQAGAYYFVDDVSLIDLGWTGIDSHSQTSFSLYPNPSNGNFQLTGISTAKTQLHIFNLLGEEIIQPIELAKGINNISLELNLKEGIYVYRIMSGEEILKEDKLIIVK
jgi:hypothetical protein